jgi:Uma2 family endonuclease
MVAMSIEKTSTLVLPTESVPTADQHVVLDGIGWAGYETLLALRGEKRRPRMTYLDGAVELMSISKQHERIRFVLGRLLELYMLELGVQFCGYGQTTYQAVHADAGFEADECYVLGAPRDGRPDLALEVVWSSGGVQKLHVYRAFGVPEVWIWQQGELRAFVLEAGEYRPADRSRLLPGAPLELLAAFAERTEQIDSDTLREFQAALRTAGHGRPLPS